MWFRRMVLEEWFNDYQYHIDTDIGESAVKYLTFGELGLDLGRVPLRYGHHTGSPALRERIAEQYPGLSGDQIVVTNGGSEAIFAVTAALVDPGDHVIVEHPNFPALYEAPRSLGCDVGLLHLRCEDQFRPDLDMLQKMLMPRTKLVSLTHPNNPTGSMITPEALQELVKWVEANGLYLLFDETYREMAFDNALPPAAALSPRAISISSMSKCYGLPGIRIGWLACQDPALRAQVLAIREQVTITNNALGEEIALDVLGRKDRFLAAADDIRQNRSLVSAWMETQSDFEWVYPEAGVVGLPRIRSHVPVDPEQLYRRLAEKYRTFVIPGRCFELDNRYFRLGFGATSAEIQVGLRNLGDALNDLKN